MSLDTPVVFIIFNRPHLTQKVFQAIRQAKPLQLFVIADGPRPNRPDDSENCHATRTIIETVDWDCEVIKNYSEVNLGCGKRVSTGITWVFEQVEEAIILEDDTVPELTFFQFCEIMLDRYRDDQRIMAISGTNFLEKWKSDIQSYHFSYWCGIWGWASWKRAWKYYDYEMKLWGNSQVQERVNDLLVSENQFKNRKKIFDKFYQQPEAIFSWDYQWHFACLAQSGLTIVPCVNQVSNIGFGKGATHTRWSNPLLENLKTYPMLFPIRNNDFVAVDRGYDQETFKKISKRNQKSRNISIGKIKKLLQSANIKNYFLD